MRRVDSILLLVVLAVSAAAEGYAADLNAARRLLLQGKYAEAAEVYEPLAQEHPAATLGLARCMTAQGKQSEAVDVLTKAAGRHAALHAELARLALERGDYPEATRRTDAALRLDADLPLARWIQAELARVAGRPDEAEDTYRRLVDYYNDHDVDRAESLRWIGLGAARYARWNRLDDQFSFLVNELFPDALKLESDYWPAHYEAARLFLEKYNKPEAEREIQAALELNPNAAEVHLLKAELAVERRDIEQAETSLDRALQLNPRLLGAWLARADLQWANFDVRGTLLLLREKALPLNRVNEATLGRVAACYVLLDGLPRPDRATRLTRLIAMVETRNPHAGEFFFTMAEALETRHRHAAASRFFRKSLEVMPKRIGPRTHLGLLAMQTGDEAEARRLLDEAFEIDPFNVRVHNMLNVLEVLDEMETLETDGSSVRYEGEQDPILARYASRYLDEFYPRMCEQFGYSPPRKPLVEVFNRARGIDGQQWFSTRMTGLPYLGAVAASTGHMVAMSSPNDARSPGRFNWAQVLRHEMVHVVTLQQTHFNIPHWYTEGLAVYYEDVPRPQLWNELLRKRVAAGELFDLTTLNFGFTRPQSGDDWQMAYCQAELYVDYMIERWPPSRQRQLLAGYAGGLATDEVIPRVLGVSIKEFEQGYVEYVQRIAAELSTLKWPSTEDFDQLLRRHREDPKDLDIAAELAYKYFLRGANQEAEDLAEKTLEEKPHQPLATYVIARLHTKAGRTDEAEKLLLQCADHDPPQPNALDLLARLKMKAKQYDEAARWYEKGDRLEPNNIRWAKALAGVYLAAENNEKLRTVLPRIARADPDDLTVRKKLAQLAADSEDYVEAADWANQAIEIDVMDADLHHMAASALAGQELFAQAVEEIKVALELKPDHAAAKKLLEKIRETQSP